MSATGSGSSWPDRWLHVRPSGTEPIVRLIAEAPTAADAEALVAAAENSCTEVHRLMCGIVGYIGPRQAAGLLLEGLRRLEYRGYDSSGIAVVNGNGLKIMKAAGKLSVLEQAAGGRDAAAAPSASGTPAGPPTARPPRPTRTPTPTSPAASPSSTTASSRTRTPSGRRSRQRGHTFKSETDTEVLAHLVGEFYQGNLEEAVAAALRDVDGAYGLAFISADEPGVLVAARKGSPLLVGVGENEWFVASDASPLLQHTRSVVYLDDGEMVVLTRDGYRVRNLETDADQQAGQPDRLGPRDGGAGRLSPLHAEGDLRAAREPLQHAPRPPAGGRGDLARHRPQPDATRSSSRSSASSSPPAAPRGTPGSSASTCWRRWRGSRWRSSTPPSSATGIRWWIRKHPGHRHLADRARRPTRWRRSARPSGAAPGPSGW